MTKLLAASVILLSSVATSNGDELYLRERIEAHASIAVNRPVDGLDYYADDGVLLAGLRYVNTQGFYAAGQVLHGKGDGVLLPASSTTNLETALGWSWHVGEHDLSFELQDYRQWQSAYRDLDYQGLALHYRYHGFSSELGFEADRPLYYRPLDRYFNYHKRRLGLAYRLPVSGSASLQLAAGWHSIDRVNIDYQHVSLRLDWYWQGLDWWLAGNKASDDVETFYSSDADLRTVTVGVSASFDLD